MEADTTPERKPGRNRGFTLAETVVTAAVIAITGAIAISVIGNVLDRSKDRIGFEVIEVLNTGLKKFSQINYEITLARDDDSSDDEFLVLRTLQWRDPVNPAPGSPFVRPNYNPVESNSQSDYRLRWNGKVFVVVPKGEEGMGLKLNFEGEDYGANYEFPDGYTPL